MFDPVIPNAELSSPHVRKKSELIVFNWSTPNYQEIVERQRVNFSQFGLEYQNYQCPVRESDAYNTAKKEKSWVPTRDEVWLEFLRSCQGICERVLLVNADVSIRKQLPTSWLSENSVLWRYYLVGLEYERYSRDITTHLMMLRTDHVSLLEIARELSMQKPFHYDPEYSMTEACKMTNVGVQIEYLRNTRLFDRDNLAGDGKIPDAMDQYFLDPKPLRMINKAGVEYYQHPAHIASASVDNPDSDTVFVTESIDQHKLERWIAEPNTIELDLASIVTIIAPNSVLFAKTLRGWLTHHPNDNAAFVATLTRISREENTNFRILGQLKYHIPAAFESNTLIRKFDDSFLYEVDDWIFCPGLMLAAPRDIWYQRPFFINEIDDRGKDKKNLFRLKMLGII